jgi:hypothetical protein
VQIVRLIAVVAIVLFGIAALLRWVARGRREAPAGAPPPLRRDARHSFELRCETHRLTVRLEADGGDEFDRARVQVRCPLCALERPGRE